MNGYIKRSVTTYFVLCALSSSTDISEAGYAKQICCLVYFVENLTWARDYRPSRGAGYLLYWDLAENQPSSCRLRRICNCSAVATRRGTDGSACVPSDCAMMRCRQIGYRHPQVVRSQRLHCSGRHFAEPGVGAVGALSSACTGTGVLIGTPGCSNRWNTVSLRNSPVRVRNCLGPDAVRSTTTASWRTGTNSSVWWCDLWQRNNCVQYSTQFWWIMAVVHSRKPLAHF